MAEFELNIYGADDEVIKTVETNKIRWGVFMQALEVSESLEAKGAADQLTTVNAFMKKIFPALTDDDLEKADYEDVLNTFKQLLNKANKIGGGNTGKNA